MQTQRLEKGVNSWPAEDVISALMLSSGVRRLFCDLILLPGNTEARQVRPEDVPGKKDLVTQTLNRSLLTRVIRAGKREREEKQERERSVGKGRRNRGL